MDFSMMFLVPGGESAGCLAFWLLTRQPDAGRLQERGLDALDLQCVKVFSVDSWLFRTENIFQHESRSQVACRNQLWIHSVQATEVVRVHQPFEEPAHILC